MKEVWNVKDTKKMMKLFDKECERLIGLFDYNPGPNMVTYINKELTKIHDHMIIVSRRIAGLEY